MPHPNPSEFQERARQARSGFLRELWGFLRNNKKWWMIPMLAIILILGVLVLVSGSPVAPFIYTLF
jgi:hypothetical protein